MRSRDRDDVERREGGGEPGHAGGDLVRHADAGQLVVDLLVPLQVRAPQQLRQLRPHLLDALAEEVDGLGELERLRPVVEQPARAALDQAARVQPDPGLDGGLDRVVERLDPVPHDAGAEDRAGRGLRPDDLLQRRAGLLAQSVQIGRTARVDRVVDQDGRGDLAVQRVVVDVLGELLAQRGREVRVQQGAQVRVVRQRGVQQLVGDRDLRVRQQDGRLRAGQALPGAEPLADLTVGGQELQRPVQQARRAPGGA